MLRVNDQTAPGVPSLGGIIGVAASPLTATIGLGRGMLRTWRPHRLTYPIAPLTAGDPEIGRAIYRNSFPFGGVRIVAGTQSIFAVPAPNRAWLAALHGFAFLEHLAAAKYEMHRAFARRLVTDWHDRLHLHPATAREFAVRAHRLIALLRHGQFLLTGAGESFAEIYFRIVARETQSLEAGSRELYPAIAVAYAAASCDAPRPFRVNALERLDEALSEHILPDGGHASRNPSVLLDLLLLLLPLRAALAHARDHLPQRLNAHIERMLLMLRFFAFGDDGLASFQGVCSLRSTAVRAALGADTTLGRPLSVAAYSGYARLTGAAATVLADFGPDAACASPLAFEFADGPQRIVVNCGALTDCSSSWAAATRACPAHSTAIIETSETIGFLRRMLGGRKAQRSERGARMEQGEAGGVLSAFARNGETGHERCMFLSRDGADLRGEDRLYHRRAGTAAADFTLRFHIHPSVRAIASKDGSRILLMLPNRHAWRFAVKGGRVSLAESVYCAGETSPRRTAQIVVTGTLDGEAKVNWAFRRTDKRGKVTISADRPQLLL
ncbi:MAG: heparinase II/III family protein [Parvibaculaceae bacterium]